MHSLSLLLIIIFIISYLKLFGGFGKILLFLMNFIFIALVIIDTNIGNITLIISLISLGLIYSYRFISNTLPYDPVVVHMEGGGIKRGLTEAEAAVILGTPIDLIISVVIIKLLDKGFIKFGENYAVEVAGKFRTRKQTMDIKGREKIRRLEAQKIGKVMYPYENLFLELFEQNEGKTIGEIDFEILLLPFINQVAERQGGFDLESTRRYYKEIIERAHIEGRIEGILERRIEKVFGKNYVWIILNQNYLQLIKDAQFKPSWFPQEKSFLKWLDILRKEIHNGISINGFDIKFDDLDQNLDAKKLMMDISRATFFS